MSTRHIRQPRAARIKFLSELGGIVLAALVIGLVMAGAAFYGSRPTHLNITDIPKTSYQLP